MSKFLRELMAASVLVGTMACKSHTPDHYPSNPVVTSENPEAPETTATDPDPEPLRPGMRRFHGDYETVRDHYTERNREILAERIRTASKEKDDLTKELGDFDQEKAIFDLGVKDPAALIDKLRPEAEKFDQLLDAISSNPGEYDEYKAVPHFERAKTALAKGDLYTAFAEILGTQNRYASSKLEQLLTDYAQIESPKSLELMKTFSSHLYIAAVGIFEPHFDLEERMAKLRAQASADPKTAIAKPITLARTFNKGQGFDAWQTQPGISLEGLDPNDRLMPLLEAANTALVRGDLPTSILELGKAAKKLEIFYQDAMPKGDLHKEGIELVASVKTVAQGVDDLHKWNEWAKRHPKEAADRAASR